MAIHYECLYAATHEGLVVGSPLGFVREEVGTLALTLVITEEEPTTVQVLSEQSIVHAHAA